MTKNPNNSREEDPEHPIWVRHSEAMEVRERLSAALKGWWKIAHPVKAWRLYRARWAASEANRKATNRRLCNSDFAIRRSVS